MCLLLIGHRIHPRLPLIVAGNRDEFHNRPAQAANWWPDKPDILGGRDLQAGGTWLAIGRNGRFATVTNFRDAEKPSGKLLSRGTLISDFLDSDLGPEKYLRDIDGDRYAGFNLLVADDRQLGYLSNRGGGLRMLPGGVYGVANATLDTPWPKVERSKAALESLLRSDSVNETTLMRVLGDRERANAVDIETTGLPFETAHALSAPFIVLPEYGTRCSTVVIRDSNSQVKFAERRFRADGSSSGSSEFAF